MAEPVILAPVLGVRTGWAASTGWPRSGLWDLTGRTRPGETRQGRMFARLGDRAPEALDRSGAGVVVVERPAPTLRGEQLDVLPGLRGVLLSVRWLRHLDGIEVAAGAWRTWLGAAADVDAMVAIRALRFELATLEEAAAMAPREHGLTTGAREGQTA